MGVKNRTFSKFIQVGELFELLIIAKKARKFGVSQKMCDVCDNKNGEQNGIVLKFRQYVLKSAIIRNFEIEHFEYFQQV